MVTVRKIDHISCKKEAWYLVEKDGKDIGMLVKWRDTRSDKHPWKALGPLPATPATPRPFLGAFYPEDGGREKATQAILDNAK